MKKPSTAAESVADVRRRFKTLFDKLNETPGPAVERDVGRVEEMKRDLGYEGATGAEQMFISHAVLCWLQLAFIELKYAYVIHNGMAPPQERLWDRRVTLAQKRFTRALTELARLRALTAAARYATARAEAAEAETATRRGPRALRA